MEIRPIFYVTGIMLLILAGMMVFPALVDLYNQSNDWETFTFSALTTAFAGGGLVLSNSSQSFRLGLREAFLLTGFSWLTVTIFGAIPFWFSDLSISFTDAFFESMSGLTTTGSTVLSGLDTMPPGILLWRAILQWLGGIGIIVMALSLLPFLGVGGMQLFKTESSEREKLLPRAAQLATSIGIIYLVLTMACALGYQIGGMSLFDAIAHAMATIATGGFSTKDASMGHFDSMTIHMTASVFMFLGALPFILYLKIVKGDHEAIFTDAQVRLFFTIILCSILILSSYLVFQGHYAPSEAFQFSTFNIISIISGTGFASTDYTLWGPFTNAYLFFLMFLGGCAGSATCAIKMFRIQIVFSVTLTQLKRLIHPHGVFIPRYNGKPLTSDVTASVMSFVFVFFFSFMVTALLLHMTGLDFITAMSAAGTAISNVGPGLGQIVGPAGNFSTLTDAAKWIMAIAMLFGRLEFFTLIVLMTPHFWRH